MARDADSDSLAFQQLHQALEHHLAQERLTEVWALKERFQRVLEGTDGPVTVAARKFLADTLGNPQVNDAAMQAAWSALMAELTACTSLQHPFIP